MKLLFDERIVKQMASTIVPNNKKFNKIIYEYILALEFGRGSLETIIEKNSRIYNESEIFYILK